MKWSDLNLEVPVWTIPASISKIGELLMPGRCP